MLADCVSPQLMVSTEVGVCSLQGGHIVWKGAGVLVVAVTTTPRITIFAHVATVNSTTSNQITIYLLHIVVATIVEADIPQALFQDNVGDLLLVTAVQMLVGAGVQAGAVLAVEVDTRRGGDVGNLAMNYLTICFLAIRTTS